MIPNLPLRESKRESRSAGAMIQAQAGQGGKRLSLLLSTVPRAGKGCREGGVSWVIRGGKVSGAAKSDGETEESGGQWGRGTPGATEQGRVSGEGRRPTLRLELPHRGEDSGRKGAGNTGAKDVKFLIRPT